MKSEIELTHAIYDVISQNIKKIDPDIHTHTYIVGTNVITLIRNKTINDDGNLIQYSETFTIVVNER